MLSLLIYVNNIEHLIAVVIVWYIHGIAAFSFSVHLFVSCSCVS